MDDVKLFRSKFSPFPWRVIWALKLKGVDYTYIEEDLSNKSAQLLEYNPVHKKVPVLVHGGKPIAESLVILEYIEEKWPHNPLLPKDPYKRAVARFWVKFVDDIVPISREFHVKAGESKQKAKADILEKLRAVEEHSGIRQKKFFGGEELGMVDLSYGVIGYWLLAMEEVAGIKLMDPHNFPHLYAWMQNFKEVPVIKENVPIDVFYERVRAIVLASS